MDGSKMILGVDIGGSHIACALVSQDSNSVDETSYSRQAVDAWGSADDIVNNWTAALQNSLGSKRDVIVGIAIPGPFDYKTGISYMHNQGKYDALYGQNMAERISSALHLSQPIFFSNDAGCFGIGETVIQRIPPTEKVLAITIGTGIGSAFIHNRELLDAGPGVPMDGYLYNAPYRDGIAEDYLSGRWLQQAYKTTTGVEEITVKEIAMLAFSGQPKALAVFNAFGQHLGNFLSVWMNRFHPAFLLLGGSIAESAGLFLPETEKLLQHAGLNVQVRIAASTERAAIVGAAVSAAKTIASISEGD